MFISKLVFIADEDNIDLTPLTGHITDNVASFPNNGHLEISLFLGFLLVEFIDGVKFIKKKYR